MEVSSHLQLGDDLEMKSAPQIGDDEIEMTSYLQRGDSDMEMKCLNREDDDIYKKTEVVR